MATDDVKKVNDRRSYHEKKTGCSCCLPYHAEYIDWRFTNRNCIRKLLHPESARAIALGEPRNRANHDAGLLPLSRF